MEYRDGMVKEAGRWDYSGHFAPTRPRYVPSVFSVGIFQWWPKKSGGPKKLPVVFRVKGGTHEPGKVYAKAKEICDNLNMGGALPKGKSVWA